VRSKHNFGGSFSGFEPDRPGGFAATRFRRVFGRPILIRCADPSDTTLALLFVKMGFLIIHCFRAKVCKAFGFENGFVMGSLWVRNGFVMGSKWVRNGFVMGSFF